MLTLSLKIEPLTPIHIGSGSEIEPYEYIIIEKFYKINLSKFMLSLSHNEQNIFLDLFEKDLIEQRKFLQEKFDKEATEYSIDVSERVKKMYESKLDDPRNQLLISLFSRESFKPYVPGSSIKGALRTGLIYYLLKGEPTEKDKGDVMEALLLESEKVFFDHKRNKFIPKGLDPQTDPFRAIKITDAKLPDGSTIIESIDSLVKKDGQIKSLDMSLRKEVTKSKFTGEDISISLEIRYDDLLLKKNKDIKRKINIGDLIMGSKKFSQDLIDCELEYYKGHYAESTYLELKDIMLNLKDNESLLRLGWGCGFNSVTINLKRKNPKIIKTRKLINNKIPLGWSKITIEETR